MSPYLLSTLSPGSPQFQIYESNSLPYTYAFNTQYAGPNKEAKNTIMVPLGSPFPPAFRMFKKVFKEKTHVEWDDRIGHAIERAKKEKRDRGLATGSEDLGSRKGVAVSVQEEKEKKEKEEKEFEVMPFEYHPPRFGPRGKIPKDKVPYGLIGEKNREIDVWMSGANGDGPDAPIDLTDGDAENANPAPKSVFDKELSEWVDENLDDLDPFDDPAANLAYIKETDARFASTNTAENSDLINQTDAQIDSTNDDELFDFGAMDQNDPADETQNGISFDQTDTSTGHPISFDFGPMDHTKAVAEMQNELSIDLRPEDQIEAAVEPQQNTSFDQTDTNATQPPISFDLPSTVQESFEPGTQDGSDTQIAERAMGEFDEFANQPMPDTISMAMDKAADSSGTQDTLTTTTTPNMDLGSSVPSKPNDDKAANADNTHGNTTASTATPNFDLGSSTLSKRKNSPNAADTVEDVTGRETHKKTKRQNSQEDADEDEASVMAAEESFDAEDAYQIATQAIEDAIGDEGSVPGNMLRESDAVFPTKVPSSYALSAVAGEPTYNGGDDFAGVVFPDQAMIDALMEGDEDGDMGLSGE